MTHFGERVYIGVSHTDSSCWKRQSLVLVVLVPFSPGDRKSSLDSRLISYRDFVTVPVSSPHNLILVPQDSDDVRREKADPFNHIRGI